MAGRSPIDRQAIRRTAIAAAAVVAGLAFALPAVQAAEVAKAKPGASTVGSYLIGRHAHATHDLGTAADHMLSVLDRDPDNADLQRNAFLLAAAEGRLEVAFGIAQRLVDAGGRSPIAQIGLAVDDLKAGRFTQAEQKAARVPRDGVASFVAPLIRAWALVGLKKSDDALQALSALAGNAGLKPVQDYVAGLLLEVDGRVAEAEVRYRDATDGASSVGHRFVEALGGLYERSGRVAEAEALYTRHLDRQSNSPLLKAALDRVKAGRPSRPIATTPAEGAAETLFVIGNSMRHESIAVSGLVMARLALHLKPDFPLAQFLVAEILEIEERFAAANETYKTIAPSSAFAWPSRLRVAYNLNRLDRIDDAARQLNAMAAERPADPDALVALGDIYKARDRFEDSVKAYDQAFNHIPAVDRRHWSLLFARGTMLERSKQWPRAEADLLRALEFEPEQPYVLNYLGYSWIDQGINIDRARKMIERAVELRPDDGYIVDSMGWVHYRLGDFANAVRDLERAVALRPDDPVINDHLGDAYWKVGRRPEAQFQWRRALSLKPEKDLQPAIQDKIERGLVDSSPRPKAGKDG